MAETATRAWHQPAFRWLWGASAASLVGTEIAELALPLLAVITLAAEADELAALRVAQFAPFLLATIPLGVVVDRYRRKPMMVGADLGRFVLIAAIPALIGAKALTIPVLCILIFGVGVLTVLYQSADFALLPSIVSRQQLTDANAKIQATASAAEISGRGIGGLLVQIATAPVAMLVNAIGYLVSAICVSRIRLAENAPEPATGSPLREAGEGLRIVTCNPILRGLLGGAATFNLFYEVFFLGLLLYFVRDLAVTPSVFAAVILAGGIGSLIGAWYGPRASAKHGYGRVLILTLILGNTAPTASSLAGLAPGHETVVLAGVFSVMGLGIGVANAHATTVRQVASPPGTLGRVNSACRLITWGAIPIGAIAGGVLASFLGGWATMAIGAVGLATATLWVYFSPVRNLRQLDDAQHGLPRSVLR